MPFQMSDKNQRGYIALFTALTVSGLVAASGAVLVLALSVSQQSVQTVQDKDQARALARGCARMIERAASVEGYESMHERRMTVVGVGECTVAEDVEYPDDSRQLHIRAAVSGTMLDMRVVLDGATREIRAQSESP